MEKSQNRCDLHQVIDLIGDKWTVRILHILRGNCMRYGELHKKVGSISQKVLTSSLRRLERDGIIKRTVYPVVPPKVEYELTELGFSVFDIVESLHEWSAGHLGEVKAARAAYDRSFEGSKKSW
jgi:DNA-binding HxlR family transcriptional regulator